MEHHELRSDVYSVFVSDGNANAGYIEYVSVEERLNHSNRMSHVLLNIRSNYLSGKAKLSHLSIK
jgi:hypothetical protein